MTRNRIAMSRALFDRLIDHASREGDPIARPDAIRFISRLSEEDADLMARGTATVVIVTRQIRLVGITHGVQSYFCTFGLPEADEPPSGLEIVPNTPGIFATAILEANIRPHKDLSSAAIKDVLDESYSGNSDGYNGHGLEEIVPFFPTLVSYRSTESLEYHATTERVLGAILGRTYLDGPINFESETVLGLSKVFEHGSPLLPYRNLIQGVLSISWENLFLEIYRCIEQLYALPRITRLKKEISSVLPSRDLAKILEDCLSWRPKEDEAFLAIIRMCDEPTILSICTGLDHEKKQTHQDRCEAAARELYELRNRIVHYRPTHEAIKKTETNWNVVIRGMLEVMDSLYKDKGGAFFS